MFSHNADGDEGFTLVEVLVAMVIFSVVMSFATVAVVSLASESSSNSSRVSAAAIASRYIEEVQHVATASLTTGTQTFTETANGKEYTVRRSIGDQQNPVSLEGVCNSRLNLPGGIYKTIRVEVSWVGMGNTKPVVNDALTTTPSVLPGQGTIVQRVVDESGSPLSGASVQLALSGQTQLTDAQGCAVFENVAVPVSGVLTKTTTSKNGMVSDAGEATKSVDFTASGGRIIEVEQVTLYMQASNVTFRLDANVQNHHLVPYDVNVGMKSGSLAPTILPNCSGATGSCVNPSKTSKHTSAVGEALPTRNLRFFPSACGNANDDSMSVSVNTLNSGDTVRLPMHRYDVSLIKNAWGDPVDDNARLGVYLTCPGGGTIHRDLGTDFGGQFTVWLSPGNYRFVKTWYLWPSTYTQDCRSVTVSSAGQTSMTMRGTKFNNDSCW